MNVYFLNPGTARRALRLGAALGLASIALAVAAREDAGAIVAIYSNVSPAYRRSVAADGSVAPETYAFGQGGQVDGNRKDMTIDALGFMGVARIMAKALARENYVPCDPKSPATTKLLIMVYWGATVGTDDAMSSPEYVAARALVPPPLPPPPPPPDAKGGTAMTSDPTMSGAANLAMQATVAKAAADSALNQSMALAGMANRARDRQDLANATVLGYRTELERVRTFGNAGFAGPRQDVIDEIESSRYFVVLMAYDFQLLWKHKERKLLWETRFSIPERRHDFGQDLAAMARGAERYFGRDSNGLRRTTLRGSVELGEMKVLEEDVDAKK